MYIEGETTFTKMVILPYFQPKWLFLAAVRQGLGCKFFKKISHTLFLGQMTPE